MVCCHIITTIDDAHLNPKREWTLRYHSVLAHHFVTDTMERNKHMKALFVFHFFED